MFSCSATNLRQGDFLSTKLVNPTKAGNVETEKLPELHLHQKLLCGKLFFIFKSHKSFYKS